MEWIKKGHIFKPDGKLEWSKDYAQVPTPIILNDIYRIFFTTRHYPTENMPVISIGYIDVDRKNPSNVLKINKSAVLTHGVFGSFDEFGQMPADIIKVGENKYYMYFTGWSRGISTPYITTIGLAVSKDNCKTFKKIFNGPILGINKFDPILVNGPSVIKVDDTFHMFYSSATKWIEIDGRKEVFYYVKKATSKNGIDWIVNNDFCIETIIDDEVQNAPRVSLVNDEYHMWFCYRKGINFRNEIDAGYRLGLATSKDLINWKRIPENSIGIKKSESGWDSEMMCYPYMICDKSKYLLFYNGNYFGKVGFGYAELKKD